MTLGEGLVASALILCGTVLVVCGQGDWIGLLVLVGIFVLS